MNNLSVLLADHYTTDAEQWASKALSLIKSTPYTKNPTQGGECASALVAVLFNLASLKEVCCLEM